MPVKSCVDIAVVVSLVFLFKWRPTKTMRPSKSIYLTLETHFFVAIHLFAAVVPQLMPELILMVPPVVLISFVSVLL
jgi:hypothetical protein